MACCLKWSSDGKFKFFQGAMAFLTVIIGLSEFACNQQYLEQLEFKKIYVTDSLKTEELLYEKRKDVYSKIAESVGTILAHDKIDSDLKGSIERFKEVYYGQALMMEDSSVNKAMLTFKLSLDDYLNGDSLTDKEKINKIGMALCDTLRTSLANKKIYVNSQKISL